MTVFDCRCARSAVTSSVSSYGCNATSHHTARPPLVGREFHCLQIACNCSDGAGRLVMPVSYLEDDGLVQRHWP